MEQSRIVKDKEPEDSFEDLGQRISQSQIIVEMVRLGEECRRLQKIFIFRDNLDKVGNAGGDRFGSESGGKQELAQLDVNFDVEVYEI